MKNFNFKAFFLNHFEKMIFATFALVVVLVLAKTSWSGYPKPPDQLLSDIEKVRKRIESPENTWKDRDEFKVVDYTDRVEKIFAPLSYSRYEFSTPIFHPLFKKNEPRKEPVFEAVMELIAKPTLVALSMKKDDEKKLDGTDVTPPAEDMNVTKIDESDELQDRRELSGQGTVKKSIESAKDKKGKAKAPAMVLSNSDRDRDDRGQGSAPTEADIALGEYGSYSANVTSRGARVIAVRGVFPLYKQAEQYEKALHISRTDAQNMIEIRDFVLERQVAQAGPDPWKDAKWEVVNVDSAIELLNESTGSDPFDPVPLRMQDSVITMKLPLRLAGFWSEFATHPLLRRDELKDEDMEAQNKMLDLVEETFEDAAMTEAEKPRRRGLSKVQSDYRSAVVQMKANPTANKMFSEKSSKKFSKSDKFDNVPIQGATGAPSMEVLDRFVSGGRYLLFRYFDTDVQSGLAYRYRVRLELSNPNYEASDEQLAAADPSIRKGELRETPWSNTTVPVVVPNTVNYYLRDVGRDPYNDEKIKIDTSKPVAQLDMFDWDTKLGTTVNDILNTYSIGSFISGEPASKKETLVLDLTLADGQQLRKDKYTFNTSDVLLDVEADMEILADQHPDLKLTGEKTKGMSRLGIIEEALVFTSLGEIKTLDPIKDKAEEEIWAARVRGERRGKEVAKKPDPATLKQQFGATEDSDGNPIRRKRPRGFKMNKD